MLKITISGSPSSNHLDVAIMLAERMDCAFISAKGCLADMLGTSPNTYYKCIEHETLEDDNKLNSIIFKKIRTEENYVADALLANVFSVNAIKIFIFEDYTAHDDFANAILRDTLIETTLCKQFMLDYTSSSNYDIYLDGTCLTTEEKVNSIIKAMQYGFNGIVTTLSSILPVTMKSLPDKKYRNSIITPIFGKKCEDILLTSNDVFSIPDKTGKTLVFVDTELPIPSVKYEISSPLYYLDWFKEVEPVDTHTLVKIMLYYYCRDNKLIDKQKAFCELAKNGDVFKTLIKLGYLK